MVDLCLGPHLPDLGRVKAFKIMKNSASYFLGDAKNDSLQRIYGVAFPDNKQMKEHIHFLEEAAKRDHRRIGLVSIIYISIIYYCIILIGFNFFFKIMVI